ncbi:MAG: hypothetical protein KGZ97_08990 [Bacteroidetes bacterium]|nr:hypothetical protein [Bacteroidota bacterium]
MNNWSIINNVVLSNGKVHINNELKHSIEGDFATVSKELLNTYSKGYGKFFKMDKLSKLGFIASEILLHNNPIPEEDNNEVAFLIGNSEATTYTDIKYHESIANIPSPAVFVYTLPNILIGEICLKNCFRGENLFYISQDFNIDEFWMHITTLLNSSSSKHIIAGWVNFINDEEYLSNIYLFSQGKNQLQLTKENIQSTFIVQ